MIFFRSSLPGHYCRWAILVVAGLLGLLMTGWVNRLLSENDRNCLERRFHMVAHARAEAVNEQFHQPLEHLTTLQHLFGSIDRVDWSIFRKFTEPMISVQGVRSYNWFPRVAAADRSSFEQNGRPLWGERFSIEERDTGGNRIPAALRARYFPLLYSVPEEIGRSNAGFNIYSAPSQRLLIDQSIDSNLPMASEIGPTFVDPRQINSTLLVLPVYRSGRVPATRDERQAEVTGVVVAVLDVGKLFAAANGSLSEIGFNVRLLDRKQTPEKQQLAVWKSRASIGDARANDAPLNYSQNIDIAGHAWTVWVESTPVWLDENRSPALATFGLWGSWQPCCFCCTCARY
jgi:CHASE1-domain containing sensor protein